MHVLNDLVHAPSLIFFVDAIRKRHEQHSLPTARRSVWSYQEEPGIPCSISLSNLGRKDGSFNRRISAAEPPSCAQGGIMLARSFCPAHRLVSTCGLPCSFGFLRFRPLGLPPPSPLARYTCNRMSLSTGMRLGPYEILAPIGAGGMGEVYKARDTRLNRNVAIKVLPSELAGHSELRQRLEREARAVSSLSHPHICALYDIGNQDGIDYLVMEYLEGETLAGTLKKGALP